MDSCGNWSMMARATVRPPTPESNTPMGASLIRLLHGRAFPYRALNQRLLQPGERLVEHAEPDPLGVHTQLVRILAVIGAYELRGELDLGVKPVGVLVRVDAQAARKHQPNVSESRSGRY